MFDRKEYMKEYNKRRKRSPEYREKNKKWQHDYRERNRERLNKEAVDRYYLRKYDLTKESFDEMVSRQDNLCVICEQTMDRPCLDHCHTTGKVREALCIQCNAGLGNAKENPVILLNMVKYLEKHSNASRLQHTEGTDKA